jgi:prepilin-type N-terminal cleavage/methylation domain-containing protein
MNCKASRYCFTLIELIIVIAIIAVLAVVLFVSSQGLKVEAVAHKLMLDLRYAQQLAISRQVRAGVSFNPTANSYFIYIGTTSAIAKDPHTAGQYIVNYNTQTEYSGIALVNTNFGDLISFDSLGRPYNSSGALLASSGTVTLQEGTTTALVTIEPNTGQIKVQL